MKKTKPSAAEVRPAVVTSTDNQFSPASFYDVITASTAKLPPGQVDIPAAPSVLSTPAVIAFYGFKGGAGRTMAMAHVAGLLAAQGVRICVVDLDLEAPGVATVFGLGNEKLESGQGTVALLHTALTQSKDEPLPIMDSLRSVEVSGRKLWFLPAGRIDERYLAQIEELGIGLWHMQDQSPLSRLVEELKTVENFDLIFLDCRTGFSALSAAALFHLADLLVAFLPLSEQIWDGLEFFLRAIKSARLHRQRPAVLLCPTMVPPGVTGSRMLDAFLPRLEVMYQTILPQPAPVATGETDEDDSEALETEEPLLREGIRYELSIAEAGRLDTKLQPTAWKNYEQLTDQLRTRLELTPVSGARATGRIDSRKILQEIKAGRGSLAFAEYVNTSDLVALFVAPGNLAAALERSTTLIVGAKGAGKTWLWRYLRAGGHGGSSPLPTEMRFAIGHGPNADEGGSLQLSPDALRDLDDRAQMAKRGTQRAFWNLYSLARVLATLPAELRQAFIVHAEQSVLSVLAATRRRSYRDGLALLLDAKNDNALRTALYKLLSKEEIAPLAEQWLYKADELLLAANLHCTLLFDGLDTGFDTGGAGSWMPRQAAFTTALLQVMADVRARCRRLSFKVFLREDLYLRLRMQNKSHLEAAKLELRWGPTDCWRIVLNLVCMSPTYFEIVQGMHPGAGRPWHLDEETLRSLLFPFWGERVEAGRAAKTANYIETRTVDAQGRMFPRTLIQLVQYAIEEELQAKDPQANSGRVLRFRSLRKGVIKASEQRVQDLKAEYSDLAPYLDTLRAADPTGTPEKFKKYMEDSPAIKAHKSSLHTETDGWKTVIRRLEDVGVLGPYSGDRNKLAIAHLYRLGLGVKGAGM